MKPFKITMVALDEEGIMGGVEASHLPKEGLGERIQGVIGRNWLTK